MSDQEMSEANAVAERVKAEFVRLNIKIADYEDRIKELEAYIHKLRLAKDETRIEGHCGKCGKDVTKIENSARNTCRSDGTRFVYTRKPDEGWCIFRCEQCHSVIDEVWKKHKAVT